MSVINKVLSQLEQRGAHTASEQTMVRAVPHSKRKSAMPLLALGLALAAGIAAWQWRVQPHKPNVAAGSIAQHPPAVVAVTVPISGVLAEEHPVEKLAPASLLSFELSSVPLPSSLRDKPVQPVISSVSPNPVVATGMPQPLVIDGSNFARDSTVTLRTSDGQVYAKRPVSSQSTTQIVINPNLGKSPDTWMVEVINSSGASSGLFAFTVQAPLAAEEQSFGQSPAPATPARSTPKVGNLLSAKTGAELAPPVGAPLPAPRPPKGQTSGGAPFTGVRSDPLAGGGKAAVDAPAGGEGKPMKHISLVQQADAEFHKAAALMQQGRIADAVAGYEAALRLDAGHDAARQALVALLLEGKRGVDAERVLQEGLKNRPNHVNFAMLLARLQVERGAVEQATVTLEKTLPYADRQADYQAFFAALLQRQNRHKEAITHYQIALQFVPDNGIWLMGYGISLQAAQRADDARDAFRRSLESNTLNPELQAFVQQKLRGL
ncbi:MAG TPA: tetratricopeptide repeat protein [Gallionella sp.]|nr:tetratricopeptide repeat protein [Gallionella sp.]